MTNNNKSMLNKIHTVSDVGSLYESSIWWSSTVDHYIELIGGVGEEKKKGRFYELQKEISTLEVDIVKYLSSRRKQEIGFFLGKISQILNFNYLFKWELEYFSNSGIGFLYYVFKENKVYKLLTELFYYMEEEEYSPARANMIEAPYTSYINFILGFKFWLFNKKQIKYNKFLKDKLMHDPYTLDILLVPEPSPVEMTMQDMDEMYKVIMVFDDIESMLLSAYMFYFWDHYVETNGQLLKRYKDVEIIFNFLKDLVIEMQRQAELKRENEISFFEKYPDLRYTIKKWSFIFSKTILAPIFPNIVIFSFNVYGFIYNLHLILFYFFKLVAKASYIGCNLFIIIPYYKLIIFLSGKFKFLMYFFSDFMNKSVLKTDGIYSFSVLCVVVFYTSLIVLNFIPYLSFIQLHKYVTFAIPFVVLISFVYLILKKNVFNSFTYSLKYVIFPFIVNTLCCIDSELFFYEEVEGCEKKFNRVAFVNFFVGPALSGDFFYSDFKKIWEIDWADMMYVRRFNNDVLYSTVHVSKKHYSQWKIYLKILDDDEFYEDFYFDFLDSPMSDIPFLSYLTQRITEPFSFNDKFKDLSDANNYYVKGTDAAYDLSSHFSYYNYPLLFSKIVKKSNLKSNNFSTFDLFKLNASNNFLSKYFAKLGKNDYEIFDLNKNCYFTLIPLWEYANNFDRVIISPYRPQFMPVYDFIKNNTTENSDYSRKLYSVSSYFLLGRKREQLQIPVEKAVGYRKTWNSKFYNTDRHDQDESFGASFPTDVFGTMLICSNPYLFLMSMFSYLLCFWVNLGEEEIYESEELDPEYAHYTLHQLELDELGDEVTSDKKKYDELMMYSFVAENTDFESIVEEEEEEYFNWYQSNYVNVGNNKYNKYDKLDTRPFAAAYYNNTFKELGSLTPDLKNHSFSITDFFSNLLLHVFKNPFQSYSWNFSSGNTVCTETHELLYYCVSNESFDTDFTNSGIWNDDGDFGQSFTMIHRFANGQLCDLLGSISVSHKSYFHLLFSYQYLVNTLGYAYESGNTMNLPYVDSNGLFNVLDQYITIQWLCDERYRESFYVVKEPHDFVSNELYDTYQESEKYLCKKLNDIFNVKKTYLLNSVDAEDSCFGKKIVNSSVNSTSSESGLTAAVEGILKFSDDYDKIFEEFRDDIYDSYLITEYASEAFPSDFYWEVCGLKLNEGKDSKKLKEIHSVLDKLKKFHEQEELMKKQKDEEEEEQIKFGPIGIKGFKKFLMEQKKEELIYSLAYGDNKGVDDEVHQVHIKKSKKAENFEDLDDPKVREMVSKYLDMPMLNYWKNFKIRIKNTNFYKKHKLFCKKLSDVYLRYIRKN